jgi:hypothetical protein
VLPDWAKLCRRCPNLFKNFILIPVLAKFSIIFYLCIIQDQNN